jgi:hypothetical protein
VEIGGYAVCGAQRAGLGAAHAASPWHVDNTATVPGTVIRDTSAIHTYPGLRFAYCFLRPAPAITQLSSSRGATAVQAVLYNFGVVLPGRPVCVA